MKKSKKNSKRTLIIVSILLVVVGLFILFKASTWGIYKSLLSDIGSFDNVVDGYKNNEEVVIYKKTANDRVEFKWFSVGNYFDNFKHDSSASTEWSETYYQYDGEDKAGMLSAGTFTSLVEATKEDILSRISGVN